MEETEYDFKAEYAKSNRASCKSCTGLIAKDSLRLAIMVQVNFQAGGGGSPVFSDLANSAYIYECQSRQSLNDMVN